ncbi:hypothetical protein [[Mycobacterium] crassicus]|uniref:DUF2285 domain-containing protein n=1 Tax=[Mycobacterium] crassicus TaxID=2872309 RepID=A0ABU5XHT1_9MYCO|nr:hypothetical protein [Mycolicibacter sp. MYC098]MEB3020882.1 hypothetical protein [Mycolicibacter sp. MYC098]
MDGDNPDMDAIKGDVIPEHTRRVSGRKGSDNGLIELALVGHPHRYRVRIDSSGPVPRLVELHLVPGDDIAEIDPATIRAVPVRRLTKAAARFVSLTERGVGVAGDVYDATDLERPDHRSGRKLDDVHYRQVARLLLWAREIGEPPRDFVREQFKPVSVPTVDRWIAEAKRRKFLPRDWATSTSTSTEGSEIR